MQPSLICLLLVGVALFASSASAKDDPMKFAEAFASVSEQCQDVAMNCFDSSEKAQKLYADHYYCELMTLKDQGTTTEKCLVVEGGCTEDEYKKVKDAACGTTSLVVSLMTIAIGAMVSVFGK